MTKVLLDIGAGSTSFVRKFKRYNPKSRFAFLCGDCRFSNEYTDKVREGGIHKFHARYDSFNVPDQSIDIVTLNTSAQLSILNGLERELVRTLKSGGLFLFAHPVGMHPTIDSPLLVPEHFTLREAYLEGADETRVNEISFISKGSFLRRWVTHPIELSDDLCIEYPASPIIRNRFVALGLERTFRSPCLSGCVYRHTESEPSLKVWMRK